jgi:hypothetical protein
MTVYLLDTNHAAQVMAGPDALRELLINRGQPDDRFFIFPVLTYRLLPWLGCTICL